MMITHGIKRRKVLLNRGQALEIFTVSWNVVEAIIAVGAGWLAGSIALVGFGLDSTIETVSAVTLYWRLRAEVCGAPKEDSERRERKALWVVGVTFLILSVYILWEALNTLRLQVTPGKSGLGIALASVSLVVMPFLGLAKHRTGKSLGSRALMADAKETFVCSYLSFTLLLGLGLNALFGWWWADPVAALSMLPFVVYEGVGALREAHEMSVGKNPGS